MSIRVTIDRVSRVAPGVWEGLIPPQDVQSLGSAGVSYGSTSVLLMLDSPRYSPNPGSLTFRMASIRVLNRGTSERAIFIDSASELIPSDRPTRTIGPIVDPYFDRAAPRVDDDQEGSHGSDRQPQPSVGDYEFLRNLPEELKEVGEALLLGVRAWHRGSLVYHPKSQKYVESPDNFWTVRIQPRNLDLRITVFGKPEDHTHSALVLKQDLASYSSLLLKGLDDVEDAIAVIRDAHDLKQNRSVGR